MAQATPDVACAIATVIYPTIKREGGEIPIKSREAIILGIVGVAPAIVITAGATAPTTQSAASQPIDSREILRQLGKRDVRVHDPSAIVKCGDEYWILFTGRGVPSIRSKDLDTWTPGPPVFSAAPAWAATAVPGNRGNYFWAPDVIKVAGRYLLFYSVSTFGRNTSAIGVATNSTLDPADKNFAWHDAGIVVQSQRGRDNFNCIDPAAFADADGKLWLSFGSFWSGIKLIELDPATGLRVAPNSPVYNLANSKEIEGSYLYRHDGHYYLFASYGLCCRGVNSTYHTLVGRADKITGPYLDRDGKDMLHDGGTLVAQTDGPLIGPGQPGIFDENGKSWFTCHFYDATVNGAARLSIRPLTWSADGWPVVGEVRDK